MEEVSFTPEATLVASVTLEVEASYKSSDSYRSTEFLESSHLPTHFSSFMKIAPINIKETLENGGDNTISNNPNDDWLPITESRNGNAYYSAFHSFNSGIGFQALMLPFAFTVLGWAWGLICLSLLYCWQFYTIWLLIQLHESVPGTRYSRYVHLSMAAFGEKLGKLLVIFPVMYLSGGACVLLIITAGETMKLIMKIITGPTSKSVALTSIECFILFICLAILLSQVLPNLNSVGWISLIGSIAAVSYCTLLWFISIKSSRPSGVSYSRVKAKSDIASVFNSLNALGIIAFAFRGHNVILEIQGTMRSSEKLPSKVPMWKGVKSAYLFLAFCFFPLSMAGFGAYGDKMPTEGGLLNALYIFHRHETSKFLLILTAILVLIHCLCSFQVYAMLAFDNLELTYIKRKKKPCSRLTRSGIRVCVGCLTFFISVAIPFIKGLAGVVGGIALPVTLAYPCFMWILIEKPQRLGVMWCLNMLVGCLGIAFSAAFFAGGIWSLVHPGIDVRFFKRISLSL